MNHRLLLPLALLFSVALAHAQSSNDDMPQWHPLRPDRVADVRTTPPPTTSETFYLRLSNVYKLLDESEPEGALEAMQRIRSNRLSQYEQAQLHRTYGFIYLQLDRESEAFEAFEKSLEHNALPTPTHQSILYSLVGYYAGIEHYEASNVALFRWFRYEADPSEEAYVLLGANFAKQGMMREALPYVVHANQLVEEPNSNWRDLQLAIHVDLSQFSDAIELVRENIGIWSDTLRNYVVLAGLYSEIGQHRYALSALSIAWHRGLMKSQTDILELVRLNLMLDAPARAGTILNEAMKLGYVEENSENLRLLLNSWTMARENELAIDVIDKLAQIATDGEYYFQKALLLNETHEWEQVVESCAQAIEKGKLEQPGAVWLLHGIALMELGRLNESISAFRNAERTDNDDIRRDAVSWIGYVQDRIRESS